MSEHCQPSSHIESLRKLSRTLVKVAEGQSDHRARDRAMEWAGTARDAVEFIQAIEKLNKEQEQIMAELSDKVIALSKAAGVLQTQLTEAQKNQQPPGTVPITQAAADTVTARVNDDLTLNPDVPAAP